jgi:hypothetical protein
MFNWFKKFHRSTAFASTSAAARLHWNFCFIKAARGSTARHYDIVFWREVADSFCAKWREIEPVSKDPTQLLEQRLSVYLSFLENTVLRQAECGNLTIAQLEEAGVFIARASVLDLRDAVLSDPAGVSPIFDLLPRAWLETAGVTSEHFDHCYFQRTGKHRGVQKLEDQMGKGMSDKILAHMSRLNEQEKEQFVRDFKEHMNRSVGKKTD